MGAIIVIPQWLVNILLICYAIYILSWAYKYYIDSKTRKTIAEKVELFKVENDENE